MDDAARERQELRQVLWTTRFIVFGLAMGVLAFGGYIVLFASEPAEDAEGIATTSIMAVGMTLFGVAARLVVPPLVVRAMKRKIAAGQVPVQVADQTQAPRTEAGLVAQVFLLKTIFAGALLEGPAFFCLFAYLSEQQPYTLWTAAGLLVAILLLYPLEAPFHEWVQRTVRSIKEESQMGGGPST